MLTKIQKWSKVFAVRIFEILACDAQESVVAPHWTIEQLVSGVNHDNVHQEHATGGAMGHEIW